jgi:hypothetical protein
VIYRYARSLVLGLAVGVGFALGRMILRPSQPGRYHSNRDDGKISAPPIESEPPSQATPRLIRLIKRYALTEFAALVGVPLALIALLFTALATRDTARQLQASNKQLELARAQAQPTFRLFSPAEGYRIVDPSAEVIPKPTQLILAMNGSARNVSAHASSVLVWPAKGQSRNLSEVKLWELAPVRVWQRDKTSPEGYIAAWEAHSTRLERLEDTDLTPIRFSRLITFVAINYQDVLGEDRHQWFKVIEWPYIAPAPQIEQTSFTVPDLPVLAGCSERIRRRNIGWTALNQSRSELLTVSKLEANSFQAHTAELDACLFSSHLVWGT